MRKKPQNNKKPVASKDEPVTDFQYENPPPKQKHRPATEPLIKETIYSIHQMAKQMGVSVGTIHNYCYRDVFPHYRIRNRTWFSGCELTKAFHGLKGKM